MIFQRLILHNFGPFCGRHTIELTPPSRTKPVVLFGGLNGAGKTSLLDALNLALYGKRANCSKRGGLAYEEFLRESTHKGAPPHEGASVELHFHRHESGERHSYDVKRTWTVTGATVRDRVEVRRDNILDSLLSESWNEQVEEFIPSGVANLFLFDGEKIESLADLDRSRDTLQTAMQSLLGLGLVEQLETDLVVLERKKRASLQSSEEQAQIAKLEAELESLRAKRSATFEVRASAMNEVDRATRILEGVEQRLRAAGGEQFEKRVEHERDVAVAREKRAGVESALRELANGGLPLLLCRPQLERLFERSSSASAIGSEVLQLLRKRDEELLSELLRKGVEGKALAAVREALRRDVSDRERRLEQGVAEGSQLPSEIRVRLELFLREVGPLELEELERGLGSLLESTHAVEQGERTLAATPEKDTLEALLAERDRTRVAQHLAQHRIVDIDAQLAAFDGEIERTELQLTRLFESNAEALNDNEDAERIVESSARTREVLAKFRVAMLARHAGRLASLIQESFQRLLRKEGLIHALRIDPTTLALSLSGADGQSLSPDRLSAGERQILAVSILWGLAKASGRALPTIIDTPMGRLDSFHRTRLVERYFPLASHQVLLLSTDEEITRGYLDKLRPHIGRSYHLIHDSARRQTRIEDGYFE